MRFAPEIETQLAVYRTATGHDRDTAIARVVEIGLKTWRTADVHMPERLCGRVHPRAVQVR